MISYKKLFLILDMEERAETEARQSPKKSSVQKDPLKRKIKK